MQYNIYKCAIMKQTHRHNVLLHKSTNKCSKSMFMVKVWGRVRIRGWIRVRVRVRVWLGTRSGFSTCWIVSVLSYKPVHECACTCFPHIRLPAGPAATYLLKGEGALSLIKKKRFLPTNELSASFRKEDKSRLIIASAS